ncbi:MAG: GTPase [Thermodesulfobacteriota bacterium]
MNRAELAALLEQTVGFLQDDGPALLPKEARLDLMQRAQTILEKAHLPGEVLYVGIVGGTGVGKSTLINALAGKEISTPSDRRPFTDRAVVYRHVNASRGLEQIADLLRPDDALHEVKHIRDLILLDLPDFDSIREAHRDAVLGILPFLDCVVWVVSPEKYADASLYALLRDTPKSHENYLFVLNKADELKTDHSSDPFGRLKEVLGDFAFRLKHDAQVGQPVLFGLSAARQLVGAAEEPVIARDFALFREFLMASRDAKEIASVKTKNLEEESRRLIQDMGAHVQPQERLRVLDRWLAAEPDASAAEEVPPPELWEHRKRLTEGLFRFLVGEDRSVGPVKLGMRILLIGWGRTGHQRELTLTEIYRHIAELVRERCEQSLAGSKHRTDSELLLTFGVTDSYAGIASAQAALAEEAGRIEAEFVRSLESLRESRKPGLTRLWQKSVLGVPVPFFIVKLAGAAGFASWLDAPTWLGLLKVAVLFGASLFGFEVLAAVLVLLVAEAGLALLLASRRVRRLERQASTLADHAIGEMRHALGRTVKRVKDERKEVLDAARAGLLRALDLERRFHGSPKGKS